MFLKNVSGSPRYRFVLNGDTQAAILLATNSSLNIIAGSDLVIGHNLHLAVTARLRNAGPDLEIKTYTFSLLCRIRIHQSRAHVGAPLGAPDSWAGVLTVGSHEGLAADILAPIRPIYETRITHGSNTHH